MSELKEEHKVSSLGVFGSYVRGEQKEDSDLDVLVEFYETPDLFEFMDLEEHLSELLGVKVELVTRNSLRGNIGQRILSEVVSV